MSFSYRYLPDIALADIAFEAEADSLWELLAACGEALTAVMVDVKSIAGKTAYKFTTDADDLETFLHDWLEELVYAKDVQGHVARSYMFVEDEPGKVLKYHLVTYALGGPIVRQEATVGQDVKAVTYHMFEAREENGHFYARVVLDI